MKAKTIRILATAIVLVGALGGLMYTSLAEGTEYYKHVDEVMADPAAWHGKKLQLHGFVVDKSIMRKPDTLEYTFQVQNKGHVVNARYTGIVPDTFKDGSEVVLKGHLGARRVHRRAERRDGEVPVEVRSGAAAPVGNLAVPALGTFVLLADLRRLRLRDRGLGRRRAAPVHAAGRERHRRVLPRHRADDGRVRHPRPRLRHRQLRDQVRPALLGRGAAARLQDRVVLGRARRLDHVLGVPARRASAPRAVYVNRERHRELIPYVVAVIAATEMFFIFLMVVHNNPFSTFLTPPPADGAGLNPLLQNFYMAIHPPSLYIGFVAMTIPFAFGIAALITGHLDDSWLRAVRRWTMVGWLFLTFGLGLGMLWAYEELGWGGYWGWDPVENAGLLPWFTATAFLHSVMVQERRGMLRVWNVTLVILTFFLTIFGTFMTRSGVVQSVHAFGEDPRAGAAVHHLHGGDPHVQLRAGDLPAAAAQGAQRARLLGVARSGVPRQQLDPAVLGVLRAVRDDVPDAERGGPRRAADRRAAVLQQVDAADRADPAAAHRHRAAARVAQVDAREPGPPVPLAGHCRGGDRRSRCSRSASASGPRASASRCARW